MFLCIVLVLYMLRKNESSAHKNVPYLTTKLVLFCKKTLRFALCFAQNSALSIRIWGHKRLPTWDTPIWRRNIKMNTWCIVCLTINNGSWKEGDASAKQSLHGTSRSEVSRATSAKGRFVLSSVPNKLLALALPVLTQKSSSFLGLITAS